MRMITIKWSSLFVMVILLMSCQSNKNTQNMNTEFKISEYEVTYKKNPFLLENL